MFLQLHKSDKHFCVYECESYKNIIQILACDVIMWSHSDVARRLQIKTYSNLAMNQIFYTLYKSYKRRQDKVRLTKIDLQVAGNDFIIILYSSSLYKGKIYTTNFPA